MQRDIITVTAGESVAGIDIILDDTNPRFDQYEDNGNLIDPPIPSVLPASEEFAG
jgi:hypothetical protein